MGLDQEQLRLLKMIGQLTNRSEKDGRLVMDGRWISGPDSVPFSRDPWRIAGELVEMGLAEYGPPGGVRVVLTAAGREIIDRL